MITEVKRQIHFQEYNPLKGRKKDTDTPPVVTIDRKYNKIVFPSRTLTILGMDDKFMSLYYEPTRKIIGWRLKDKLNEKEFVGKKSKWKLVKRTVNGNWTCLIKGILDSFNGSLKQEKYKDLEVKKYVEQEGIINKGDVYYFVELKDEYTQKELIQLPDNSDFNI